MIRQQLKKSAQYYLLHTSMLQHEGPEWSQLRGSSGGHQSLAGVGTVALKGSSARQGLLSHHPTEGDTEISLQWHQGDAAGSVGLRVLSSHGRVHTEGSTQRNPPGGVHMVEPTWQDPHGGVHMEKPT